MSWKSDGHGEFNEKMDIFAEEMPPSALANPFCGSSTMNSRNQIFLGIPFEAWGPLLMLEATRYHTV